MDNYDLYVSFHEKDEAWVREWLVPLLEDEGLSVALSDVFLPGASILGETSRLIDESNTIIAVLSPEYLESGWDIFESTLARDMDPSARSRKLIPILLRPSDIPVQMRGLRILDFTNPIKWKKQLDALVDSLSESDKADVRGDYVSMGSRVDQSGDLHDRIRGLVTLIDTDTAVEMRTMPDKLQRLEDRVASIQQQLYIATFVIGMFIVLLLMVFYVGVTQA